MLALYIIFCLSTMIACTITLAIPIGREITRYDMLVFLVFHIFHLLATFILAPIYFFIFILVPEAYIERCIESHKKRRK